MNTERIKRGDFWRIFLALFIALALELCADAPPWAVFADEDNLIQGNVGIGTTSPGGKRLKVQGDTDITGTLTVGVFSPSTLTLSGDLTVNGNDIIFGNGSTISNATDTDFNITGDGDIYLRGSGSGSSFNIGTPASGADNTHFYYGGTDDIWLSYGTAAASKTHWRSGITETMTLKSNGFLGIGTTDPGELLHVGKNQNAGTKIKLTNMTAGASAYASLEITGETASAQLQAISASYTGDLADYIRLMADSNAPGLIIQSKGDQGLQFWVGNNDSRSSAQRMVINSSGSVGIGTTSPGAKLDVAGDIKISAASTEQVLAPGIQLVGTNGLFWMPSGGLIFKYGSTGSAGDRVMITNAGSVGIGTMVPGAKLHVLGSSAFPSAPTAKFESTAGGVQVMLKGSSSAYRWGLANGWSANDDFYVIRADGADAVTVPLTILAASGNVGIGTTAPPEQLTVGSNSAGATQGVMLVNAFGGQSTTQYLAQHGIFFREGFTPNAGTTEAQRRNVSITTGAGTSNLGDALDINANHHISFFTNGTSEAMRIQGSGGTAGNVGIGTTGPTSDLYIKQKSGSQFVGGIVLEQAAGTNKAAILYGSDDKLYNFSGASGYTTLDTSGNLMTNTGTVTIQGNTQLGLKLSTAVTSLLATNWYRIATLSSTNSPMTVKLTLESTSRHQNIIINIDKGTGFYTAEVYEGGRYVYAQNIKNVRIVDTGVNLPIYVDVQVGADEGAVTYIVLGDYRGNAANGLVLNAFVDQGAGAAGHIYPVTSVIRSFGDGISAGPVLTLKEGGNVGIGTTAPDSKLTMKGGTGSKSTGNPNSAGQFLAHIDQNNNAPSKYGLLVTTEWASSENTVFEAGLDFQASNYSSYFKVRGDGLVGIGTTGPGYKLDVQGGDINASGNLREAGTALSSKYAPISGSGNYMPYTGINADTYVNLRVIRNAYDNSGMYIGYGRPEAVRFFNDTTEVGRFNQGNQTFDVYGSAYISGNVGIGTTGPVAKLHVAGSQADGIYNDPTRPIVGITGIYPHLVLMSGNSGNPNHGAAIMLGGFDAGASGNHKHWSIGTSGYGSTFLDIGYHAGTDLNPHAGIRNYNGSTFMTILNTGNVGIGTTGPVGMLDVRGTQKVFISSTNDSWGQLQVGNSNAGEASMAFISGVTAFGAPPTSSSGNSAIWLIGANTYSSGNTKFNIANVGAGGNLVTVQSNGNVGIGTANPNAVLEVGSGSWGTNLSNKFIVNGGALGGTAGNYAYPAEIQNSTGNLMRLQFAPYRRATGASWADTAYRIQYAVDNSFTNGSKAYVEIGGDDPNAAGGGFISLGTEGIDRLVVRDNGSVGIGMTAPGTKLDVGATTSDLIRSYGGFTGNAAANIGGTGAAAYFPNGTYIAGSSNWIYGTVNFNGILQDTSAKWSINPNGTVFFNTGGNVGIGTTSPNAGLHIYDRAIGSMGLYGLGLSTSASWAGIAWDSGDSTKTLGMHFGSSGNDFRFGRYADGFGGWEANPVRFSLNAPNEAMVLDGNGSLFLNSGYLYTPYSMRLGEIVGYGGLYRSSGDMMFYTEGAAGFRWRVSNVEKMYLDSSGNLTATGTIYLMDTNHSIRAVGGQGVYIDTYGVTDPFFIQQSTGNVGIGTTAPKARLHVTTGTADAYPTLGTSSGNLFLGSDNSLYGLYEGSVGADGNSWLQVMRNDSATAYNLILQPVGGNVGIGTTPSYKLDVAGNMRVVSGDNSYTYYGPNASWAGSLYVGATSGKAGASTASVVSSNGNLHLDSGTGNDMYLNYYVAGRPIHAYGPIDSGYTITAPTFSGNATSATNADTTDGYHLNQAVTSGANTQWGTTYTNNWFRSQNATGWYNETYAGGIWMDQADYVRVYNGKGFTVPGNVGIGTTNPTRALSVTSTVNNDSVFIDSATENTTLSLNTTGTSGRWYQITSSAGSSGYGAGNFSIVDRTAGIPRLSINSSGNVGIGTTGPGKILDVLGAGSDIRVGSTTDAAHGVMITPSWGAGERAYLYVDGGNDNHAGRLRLSNGASDVTAAEIKMRNAAGTVVNFINNGGPSFFNAYSVGIGTTNPGGDLFDVRGRCFSSGGWQTTDGDYAEWFEKEEDAEPGDIIGINPETGKVRKYRPGDEVLGIYSSNPAFVGNRIEETDKEMAETHLLVGLVGQLDFKKDQAVITGRIVTTIDEKRIGVLLSNGKIVISK